MLTLKAGFPESDELVLCTVRKVQPHAVTVSLDEFQNKSGLIHISEISPGRIRNIRDFVREGKVIVCKVLRINQERGYIDLSLRRVSDRLKRNKINEVKQEQMAEKIVEFIAKAHKKTLEQLYGEIKDSIFKNYDSLYDAFEAVVEENVSLADLGVDKKLASELEESIRQRIKPAQVKIGGEVEISTYSSTGVEDIKVALKKAFDISDSATIRYLGAGKYGIEVVDSNFKDAEATLAKVVESVENSFEKDANSHVEFQRKEIKAKA